MKNKCEVCGAEFHAIGTKRACSERCQFERFISKDQSGCWLWTGQTTHGYGIFYYRGTTVRAHRQSYRLYKGRIDPKLDVLHACDVKNCVNPDHLSLGDHTENMRQAKERGRFSKPRRARYTVQQIEHVIGLLLYTGMTQAEISRRTGVEWQVVSNIKCGRAYLRVLPNIERPFRKDEPVKCGFQVWRENIKEAA